MQGYKQTIPPLIRTGRIAVIKNKSRRKSEFEVPENTKQHDEKNNNMQEVLAVIFFNLFLFHSRYFKRFKMLTE